MIGKQALCCILVTAVMSMVGGFLAVAVLLDGAPASAQPATGQSLAVNQLSLVDDSGEVRARLDLGDDGAARFTLLDQAGQPRIQFSAKEEGCSISLLDAKGTPRHLTSQTENNDRVTVAMADAGGSERHLSALTKEGDCLVAFTGPADEKWLTLLAGPEQASTVILADPKSGQNIVTFAGRGQASLQISDKEGAGGFLGSVLGDGRSVLALSKDGKLRVRAMTKEDGAPDLRFLDDERNPTWKAE